MSQEDIWQSDEIDDNSELFDFEELIPEIRFMVYEWMRENSKPLIEKYIKEKEKELLGTQSVKPKMKREGAYLDLTQSDSYAMKKEKSSNRSTQPLHEMLTTPPKKKRE